MFTTISEQGFCVEVLKDYMKHKDREIIKLLIGFR